MNKILLILTVSGVLASLTCSLTVSANPFQQEVKKRDDDGPPPIPKIDANFNTQDFLKQMNDYAARQQQKANEAQEKAKVEQEKAKIEQEKANAAQEQAKAAQATASPPVQ